MAGSHLEASAGPARRNLRFVAGLVIALALAWFVFLRGGGAEQTRATLPSDVPASIEESVDVAEAKPSKAHRETFKVFAPKDPFDSPVEVEEPKGKGADASGDGHSVMLDSISGAGDVVVTIDGAAYEPTVGEVFAETFQLVTVDGRCASLLYGDDQFTLCEGQEITK